MMSLINNDGFEFSSSVRLNHLHFNQCLVLFGLSP